MNTLQNSKVAIVYDWVVASHGGAEHILQELHSLFPNAPLYTAVWNRPTTPWTKAWPIFTSFLQKIPGFSKHHRLSAPLLPLAFETLNLHDFDIIISVTSFAAKGVLTLPHQLHLSYVLSPPRFLYSHVDTYWDEYQHKGIFAWITQPFQKYLKRWDQVAATRPDVTIAISNLVAERIKTTYNIKTNSVIYPPIPPVSNKNSKGSEHIQLIDTSDLGDFILTGGRLVKYKAFDTVIELAEKLQKSLIVFGDGPERKNLENLARKTTNTVIFTGHIDAENMHHLIEKTSIAVYPAVEDFGITQAQVAFLGTPLIVHEKSGVSEIINSLPNVITISELSINALATAAQNLLSAPNTTQQLERKMKMYDTTIFATSFLNAVETAWNTHSKNKKGNRYER